MLRTRFYPGLHEYTLSVETNYQQLSESYIELLRQTNKEKEFELIRVAHQKGRIIVTLRKMKSHNIHKNDLFAVIDKEDGHLMGIFKVIDHSSKEIYVQEDNNIDALWSGFVRQQPEIQTVPNLIAITVPKEKVNHG